MWHIIHIYNYIYFKLKEFCNKLLILPKLYGILDLIMLNIAKLQLKTIKSKM